MKGPRLGQNCQKVLAINDPKDGLLVRRPKASIGIEAHGLQDPFGAKSQTTRPYQRSVDAQTVRW